MGIGAPVAPSTVTRIPSTGDLLLIWNDCFRERPGRRGGAHAADRRDLGDEGGRGSTGAILRPTRACGSPTRA
jgi:hypothetical protein